MNRNQSKKLGLIFFVAFSLRIGISSIPPLLPVLKKELLITEIEGSFLTSIPVVCMGIFAFLVPYIQEKLGRRKGIYYFLLLLSLGILLRAIASSYYSLLFTAFLIGIAIAIIGPLLSGFIKFEFPQKVGLAIGVYSLSMGVGAAFSSGSITHLTQWLNGQWNVALASFSIITLIAAFVWYKMTENVGYEVVKKEKEPLPLHNLQAWKVTLYFGLQSGIFYGITTWISSIAYNRGLSLSAASYLLTFYTLIQMSASFFIPFLMDYFGTTKKWSFFSSLFVCCGIIFMLSTNSYLLFIFGVFFVALGLGGLFPIALLLPIQLTNSGKEASSWTSMVQSIGYIIGGLIPVLMGVLAEKSTIRYASLWFLLILAILLIGINFKLIGKQHKK
ncbi:MFS transporter [Enterococcus sp. LJL99]